MRKKSALDWIETQKETALDHLIKLAEVNSYSGNEVGLLETAERLSSIFGPLCDNLEIKDGAIISSIRSKASFQVLLGGHMDTVYPPHSPFQKCVKNGPLLMGPGVADMKGGLMVLWLALSAFEKFKTGDEVGFRILINPDEEIGSPKSAPLWKAAAENASFGLLFEPSFEDGSLVEARKGSMNFSLHVKGVAAHAGRDPHLGKNAAKALAEYIVAAYLAADKYPDLSLNVATLGSDVPINIVCERANCRLNIRSFNKDHLYEMEKQLQRMAKDANLEILLEKESAKDPKPRTKETDLLLHKVKQCGQELGLHLQSKSSGGLSDGNILASCGLANLDTLGVVGGRLHSIEEFMVIDSLVERAKLTFLFLMHTLEELSS